MSTTRGFTLTELLVVIAVIAILAAMLMPAIGLVRASAQRAVCAGNVRQLAMGVIAYAEEEHGVLPPAGIRDGGTGVITQRGNNYNWVPFEVFPNLDSNLHPAACDFLKDAGVLNAKTAACPGVTLRTPQRSAWWGGLYGNGVHLGGFAADYVYWGQADNLAWQGKGPAPYPFAPWTRRIVGGTTGDGRSLSYDITGGSRWTTHVRLREDDLESPPLFSDLCRRTPWADDFSHAMTLAASWVNTAHLDGHVSGNRVNPGAAPFYYAVAWGSDVFYYR